ncbi:MAG TPA: hypothetical protein VKV40_01720 [Ktedonobacteraceae bacterium]|nr:hypothetical protein [Ktedonobacteraceae bacterium]
MDILYLVDRLENLIASSRRVPLLKQILIEEGDILTIVEQMRTSIPDEIKQARRIIQDKERILAQAQADASALLAKAREEADKAVSRESLLRAAEERAKGILRRAEEQAQQITHQAGAESEQLKNEADAYVAETLRGLREHLMDFETEVDRWILSIEKGLESLGVQNGADNGEDGEESDAEGNGENEENAPVPYTIMGARGDSADEEDDEGSTPPRSHPIPRRASLANDTMGGPML